MTGLSAILFLFGLLALSPSVTRAQDAQGWYSWDVGPSAGPETKSQPLNLAGCWGGTEQDQGGPGQLFINFVQRANKITKGSDGGIAFSNGQHVSGPVTGSVTSSNFHVGFHRGSCNVSFSGTLPGGGPDLIGKFNFKCPPSHIMQHFKGTFDLVRGGDGC